MCRSTSELSNEIRAKIALFASLPLEAVVSAYDVDDVYKGPARRSTARASTTSSWASTSASRPGRLI